MNFLGIFKRIGLRTKFVLVVSAVIMASMITISGYLINRQNEIYRTQLEKRAQALLVNLAYNAEYGVILEAKSELEDLIKGVARENDIIFVSISDNNDTSLASIGEDLSLGAAFQNSTQLEFDNKKLRGQYLLAANGIEFLELVHPVETIRQSFSRENLGAVSLTHENLEQINTEVIGYVRLGLTYSNLGKEITKSQAAAILLTFVILISAIIIMTAFVRIITRPIESLVDITDKISKGDLSKNVDVIRNDEIGHLATSFNRMIQSLKYSQREIETYNRTLEEKIIERTTELEDTQAQLIQSEKMVAIGQLAAGVAHELNNPLGGILGYAQFTLEKMHKLEPDAISEKQIKSFIRYLKDIEGQSRRCKAIVQNLLRFSRTSKGTDFAEVNINEVIEDTLTFVEHQLMMNQVTLEKEIMIALPNVTGNAGQLQQVFTNIIINAMHASEANSIIRIESRLAPPLGEFHGAVEVSIIDQGHGISEENMKKLFEPFFTTKEVGKGTGLGLSVSYGIIKEHAGEIRVKSEIGVGTTFTVIIPLEKKNKTADTKI